ncbi:MAG: S-methyl-5-thioribose-1-phosphate isomerase [Candidatus Parvarchaeota archaeon]|nr:S-methyl-5-thioribose-1-phosphate isomerase [Candidatus Jingweiarchaeum tengchongense]MCW1297830.1 S-methyl-5-thioribose-1-phosphate isomerase [Candidatus Jingweiarchaeum tengchongense]MCW1299841.1 S-methyl-5-thioribose-1-phosphate isomerase [Candidatus Jingweiarchaeum tengchongense]MCW1304189.1 S-methyl-5-thioribose-1-phosphate isomerase [Candidatus Jingweiarchaeum tengchongense]MCW1305217.1 S-methyl-5-thioribose-1-phosphate isomerase [Candidatus Jingweiarchaeum tengchongense]
MKQFDIIERTASKIKELKIQGAENIAKSALQRIQEFSEKLEVNDKYEFINKIEEAKKILAESRPTEPLMLNSLNFIITMLEKNPVNEIKELKHLVSLYSNEFLHNLESAKNKIAEVGSTLIKDEEIVFTHCHSSTVMGILKKAKENGKRFSVICTETRPLFQGRKTAKELSALGIPTTMIVDAASSYMIEKANIVIVGADAITPKGIINKVGTSLIALAAKKAWVPFYVACELYKFDPRSLDETYIIEERDRNEIWKTKRKMIEIRNPAFDLTENEYITGIISEEGIQHPQVLIHIIQSKYPWLFRR